MEKFQNRLSCLLALNKLCKTWSLLEISHFIPNSLVLWLMIGVMIFHHSLNKIGQRCCVVWWNGLGNRNEMVVLFFGLNDLSKEWDSKIWEECHSRGKEWTKMSNLPLFQNKIPIISKSNLFKKFNYFILI